MNAVVVPPTEQQQSLRLHRMLLVGAGLAYLGWWFYVRAALPNAFNPFASRAAVVVGIWAVAGATYRLASVARHVDLWLGVCLSIATIHYYYLFDQNGADLNWFVGSYIMVIAACSILQTSRALAVYSLCVLVLSIAMLTRHSNQSYVVFFPGMVTILAFANLGLHGRLRLHQRLRDTNLRIEGLFDAGFDGIAVHEGGVVRQANGALAALLGYSKAELLGIEVGALFAAGERERLSEIIAGRVDEPAEMAALKKDGSRVYVELLAKEFVLEGHAMQQIAFRDLTERKRAELALIVANRELEAFSYSVAHDLRSPLRAMNGFSRVLVDEYAGNLDAGAKEYLDQIAKSADTMARLIDALLGLARLARAEMTREPVDLSAQAEAIASELRASDPERRVEISIEPGIVATGDPRLLRAVLDNLLRNAWKFTSGKPEAHVSFGTTEKDGARLYYVKDDGVGFDMAYAKKLFGPFQRLHEATEFPGAGIGLANVQRIVERHNGRVWGEAEIGVGATFYFTLGG